MIYYKGLQSDTEKTLNLQIKANVTPEFRVTPIPIQLIVASGSSETIELAPVNDKNVVIKSASVEHPAIDVKLVDKRKLTVAITKDHQTIRDRATTLMIETNSHVRSRVKAPIILLNYESGKLN